MSSVQYLIGKTLSKYEVLEHIGHGGMAEVYKGQHSQLDRMVAIKVLHPFLASDVDFVARFQREARIVATLRHPNIVQAYDFDYNDELDIYYMVMEYIEGPTLKDLLEEEICTPEQTIRIGAAIADALDYAHQRSMVHRDIKPANIMFLDDGQPVLTDFGIARMLTLSGLTASGAMVGTPAYMAPEIGLGGTGTMASDIYSLSVVLYQTVTGALPFTAETPMGMVMQHINKSPLRPSAYVPDLPQSLEAVIMRGLKKEPDDRYASAGDMARALQLLLGAPSDAGSVNGRADGDDAPPPASLEPKSESELESGSDAMLPEAAPLHDEAPSEASRKRLGPWLRGGLLLFLVLLIGAGLWYGLRDLLLSDVRTYLGRNLVPPSATTASPPAEATDQPPVLPTATQPLMLTAQAEIPDDPTPVPSRTAPVGANPCIPRVYVNGVQIKPDEIVAPGASAIAYVSLRNSGGCAWPAGAAFSLIDHSSAISSPTSFSVAALPPGETIQFLIPLTLPEALGDYEMTWELQVGDQPLGRGGSGLVTYQITVADIPALPLPTSAAVALVTPTPTALEVLTPTLLSWELLPAQNLWRGTVGLTLTGGTGIYRIYREAIRAETEVVDGVFIVEAPRCRPAPVDLWILSGAEALNWTDAIVPPTAMSCP